jgi:hypothetical protein
MQSHFIKINDSQDSDNGAVARQLYDLVCRTDFTQPGFALLRLAPDETSTGQRRLMVQLKEYLSSFHFKERGSRLDWFNMTRFDQKNTTKPHRDGAPSESLLILGYEPTVVKSNISMADYSKCAYELGLTPDKFLEEFNPMYEKGLELLAPFTTQISEFDPSFFQILIVNNSSSALSAKQQKWQGVLHSAIVSKDDAPRIINSTCIAPCGYIEAKPVSDEQISEFLESTTIAESYA